MTADMQADPRVSVFRPRGHFGEAWRAGSARPGIPGLGFQEVHREDVLGRIRSAKSCSRWAKVPTWCSCWSPSTPESPVAKQIEKNGGRGGLAHVALRVNDIQKAFDYLQAERLQVSSMPAPRKGSRGTTVFFVHPKDHRSGRFRLPDRSRPGGRAMPEASPNFGRHRDSRTRCRFPPCPPRNGRPPFRRT